MKRLRRAWAKWYAKRHPEIVGDVMGMLVMADLLSHPDGFKSAVEAVGGTIEDIAKGLFE